MRKATLEGRRGEPGVNFCSGGFGRMRQPGMRRSRQVGHQIFELPFFDGRKGRKAKRIGHAPANLNEVLEAPLIGHGLIGSTIDGRGELRGGRSR